MRSDFLIPTLDNKEVTYFCGNSLGLQPVAAASSVRKVMQTWAEKGVEGHFYGKENWYTYHTLCTQGLMHVTGAENHEVVCMNALTVNIHILLYSFYQPKPNKFKILVDYPLFPSDKFALESIIKSHGYDPESALVYVYPIENGLYLTKYDIIRALDSCRGSVCLFWFSGVNFYTGQYFDIPFLAQLAHKEHALLGLDLAHAIGNVPLQLHSWHVDFATWCSYKYLNSGPGGISGVFIHSKHHERIPYRRMEGWWGHDPADRFDPDGIFKPMRGAEAWQLSNAPVLLMAVHHASLSLFLRANIENLRIQSISLTNQMAAGIQFILEKYGKIPQVQVITPDNAAERGCQISIRSQTHAPQMHEFFYTNAIITDLRKPNVVRVAPVPLYNTPQEVAYFLDIFEEFIKKVR